MGALLLPFDALLRGTVRTLNEREDRRGEGEGVYLFLRLALVVERALERDREIVFDRDRTEKRREEDEEGEERGVRYLTIGSLPFALSVLDTLFATNNCGFGSSD